MNKLNLRNPTPPHLASFDEAEAYFKDPRALRYVEKGDTVPAKHYRDRYFARFSVWEGITEKWDVIGIHIEACATNEYQNWNEELPFVQWERGQDTGTERLVLFGYASAKLSDLAKPLWGKLFDALLPPGLKRRTRTRCGKKLDYITAEQNPKKLLPLPAKWSVYKGIYGLFFDRTEEGFKPFKKIYPHTIITFDATLHTKLRPAWDAALEQALVVGPLIDADQAEKGFTNYLTEHRQEYDVYPSMLALDAMRLDGSFRHVLFKAIASWPQKLIVDVLQDEAHPLRPALYVVLDRFNRDWNEVKLYRVVDIH